MQEKRKKFWVVFSISIIAILSIAFVFGMITNLKNVNIEFRQRLGSGETKLEENVLDLVKESGEFEYGKGLLFVDVQKSINLIEKNNPFIKVEQVIRDFPNNLTVYISEREPCCYARFSSFYLVLDKEFKVLDKIQASEEGYSYLISEYTGIYEINYKFQEKTISKGDFVTDNGKMELFKSVHAGIVGAREDAESVKSVKIDNSNIVITMKKNNSSLDDGVVIRLNGTEDLSTKTFVAIEFFEKIDQTKSAQVIEVIKVEGTNTYRAYLNPDEE